MKFKITHLTNKTKGSFWLLGFFFMAPMLFMYQNCSKVGVSDIAPESSLNAAGAPPTSSDPICTPGDATCGDGVPNPITSSTPPDTCTTPISTTMTNKVKLLFLMDVSGSNVSGDSKNGDVPTDPNVMSTVAMTSGSHSHYAVAQTKPWRASVLTQFLNKYMPLSNFSHQIATFQGNSATADVLNSSGKAVFSNNPSVVYISNPNFPSSVTDPKPDPYDLAVGGGSTAFSKFLQTGDGSSTPYQAVLNMAASTIQYDGDASAQYVVVMMTDGMPSDDQFNLPTTSANVAALKAAVAQMVNIAPGRVTFNTVLYYPPNHEYVNAEAYLQAMADAGSGKFNKADSSGLPLQIDGSVTVPNGTTTCPNPANH